MAEFISRHIGITETEQTQMLEDLGLSSLDELVRQIVPVPYVKLHPFAYNILFPFTYYNRNSLVMQVFFL